MPIHSLIQIGFLNAKKKEVSSRRRRKQEQVSPRSVSDPFVRSKTDRGQLTPHATPGQKSHRVSRKENQVLGSQECPLRVMAPEMGKSEQTLSKAYSESKMISATTLAPSAAGLIRDSEHNSQVHWGFHGSEGIVRRCMTETDIWTPADDNLETPSQSPNLLQLFNIFQFNRPEQPLAPARMVVTVTLVGTLRRIRLLVGYDASVQDVIKASLKAFVKEGRLPRNRRDVQAYGLHYSQFCLESINSAEAVRCLGTRSFFLHPSSFVQQQLPEILQSSKSWRQGKPWWSYVRLICTRAAGYFFDLF